MGMEISVRILIKGFMFCLEKGEIGNPQDFPSTNVTPSRLDQKHHRCAKSKSDNSTKHEG